MLTTTRTLWGGTSEYVIPYTGYYEISLAGSQGSSYSSNSGGKGYVLYKKVYLNKGDVLRPVVGTKPAYAMSGATLTVPGGNCSELYLNGTLQWRAGGGAAMRSNTIAPNGITQVVYHGGKGTTVGAGNSTSVHWHSGNSSVGGGCYTTPVYRHDHNSGCYGHVCDGDCHYVEGHYDWVYDDNDDGEDTHGWHRKWIPAHTEHSGNQGLVCGGQPLNTFDHWGLGCGLSQGQILQDSAAQPGTCFVISTGQFANPAQSLTQEGTGVFSCKLATQGSIQTVSMSGVPNGDKKLNYLGGDCNLVLYDERDYVAYFRRN